MVGNWCMAYRNLGSSINFRSCLVQDSSTRDGGKVEFRGFERESWFIDPMGG